MFLQFDDRPGAPDPLYERYVITHKSSSGNRVTLCSAIISSAVINKSEQLLSLSRRLQELLHTGSMSFLFTRHIGK